jgi:rhodanese-related sulfurtransferase/DNA-binding transcriptional ArsR family regulator
MSRRFKDRLFGELARVSKAVASSHRLEIIELLAQGERTVEGVASALSMPVANASHHLRSLHAARLVDSRREGTFIHYRLADPLVFELVRTVRTLAERRLGEVERITRSYFDSRDQLEPVAREDLLDRVRQGDVIVLDVRPAAEYRAGHIDGAISIPTTELKHRLRELPPGKEIVAYCRGPYCVMAVEAVTLLRARGRKARRLADGYPEWQAAGLPTRTARSVA